MFIKKHFCFSCLLILVLIVALSTIVSAYYGDKSEILLKARHFTPDKGLSNLAQQEINLRTTEVQTHLLVQFEHIPTDEEKKELEELGIKLGSYVPNNAWYVSVPNNKLATLASNKNIRAVDAILPDYKKSSAVREMNFGDWAMDNDYLYLIVELHEDVPLNDKTKSLIEQQIKHYEYIRVGNDTLVEERHGKVLDEVEIINALIVAVPVNKTLDIVSQDKIDNLAGLDEVQWIDEISPPPEEELDQSRGVINVNTVQTSPYNLTGLGVTILQYEDNVPFVHDDMAGRIEAPEWTDSEDDHATHVAGIMIGDGTNNNNYRGIATEANIVAYEGDSIGYNQLRKRL